MRCPRIIEKDRALRTLVTHTTTTLRRVSFSCDVSATMASVVMSRPAMEAAPWIAQRTTRPGSPTELANAEHAAFEKI
jgi:hypothetical protein